MIKRRPYFNPNPYFNKDEFNNAIMNIGCDPYGAKDRLESYLKSYPQDGSAYGYYASLLIRLGYFSSAEQIVNKLEQLLATAKPSYRSLEKDKLRLIEAKVKLLSYQKKYEELYAYCCEHSLELTKTRPNLRTAKFWCEKQLGLIELDKKDSYSYEYSQIANYSEEDFLSHMREIRLHSDIYQHIPSDKQSATFSPSFPFNEILSEVKQSFLPQNKLYSTDGFTDMYFFRYPECGIYKGQLQNYFRVATMSGTEDIFDMHPFEGTKKLPHVDLSYLSESYSISHPQVRQRKK